MGKIVRLTENDLVRLINKVIKEQNAITNVNKSQPKTKGQTYYSDTIKKPQPQEIFKNFPCLDEEIKKNGLRNNTLTVRDRDKKNYILLPEYASQGDKWYDNALEQADNRNVGKVQGGGVYFCQTFPNVGRPVLQFYVN